MLPTNTVVYDIETYENDPDIKEFDIDNHSLAVAVTYDSHNGYRYWQEDEPIELAEFLNSHDYIVGYNIKGFDNVVLGNYDEYILQSLKSKSIDLLELIELRLGHRISLSNVIEATLKKPKTADGEEAMSWWSIGEIEKVKEYCKNDVQLTLELYLYGIDHEEIQFTSGGQLRKVKIDWHNPEREFQGTDYSYQLVDNESGNTIELDRENTKFFQAFELAKNTTRLFYLTGKAGTGKTTFLKFLKRNLAKNVAIVAYTGVASINAGGRTINSFFAIGPKEPPFAPNDKRLRFKAPIDDPDRTTIYSHFQYSKKRLELIKSLEVLIIDEISMVRADMLDVIDRLLRAFSGKNRNQAFGGVQVILIGDTFQLPPIEGKEWNLVSQYYKTPYFFSSTVFKDNLPIYIELDKIYRQKDDKFIDLLNRIRINEPHESDINLLNSKICQLKEEHFREGYVVLCSRNDPADAINMDRLDSLTSQQYEYEGEVTGSFPEGSMRTERNLILKVGAQVMILVNGNDYFNGKIGQVVNLEENEIQISLKNNIGEEKLIHLEKHTWENIEYIYDKELKKIVTNTIGTFTQFPIKLAWAITVNKSQGLTFEKIFINIDWSNYGLAYVALSRCTSLENIRLLRTLRRDAIKTDPRVVAFANHQTPATLIVKAIDDGKADFLYLKAYDLLKEGDIPGAYNAFLNAIEIRNDIETGKIQRVILHFLRKGKHYRAQLNETKLKNDELSQTLNNLIELSRQQEEDIEKLKAKAGKFEEEYYNLNESLESKTTECNRLVKEKKSLQSSIDFKDRQIRRLESLSWWDKLIGRQ